MRKKLENPQKFLYNGLGNRRRSSVRASASSLSEALQVRLWRHGGGESEMEEDPARSQVDTRPWRCINKPSCTRRDGTETFL